MTLTIKSKEHSEMMAQFEEQFSHLRLDRESKEFWPKQRVYQDGQVNELFLAFRKGVAYGISGIATDHTDHDALLEIQELMDGVEWTPDTLESIALILENAGYRIRDTNVEEV